ncbi:uncharacterized protein EI90DRAFT_3119849 [Cantharellus anzutake]|uniref:uncharacterized protein n=1 Tax=Cantharellus anzutake TaxID=1750568 RepID=UPI001902E58E|nr:uncharacterized protein EI90DRAFT_3119849 [Cantharellus anzutake]KAF8336604.1 hypothetical protein EI90DRAFT_3119849 [Cantharellus anzutake]
MKDLGLTEGFFPHFKLSPIPHKALPQHVRYISQCANSALGRSLCEGGRLSVDRTSKDVIRMLAEVFSNVSEGLRSFPRLQEAYELANGSGAWVSSGITQQSRAAFRGALSELSNSALGNLFASLEKLGQRSEALAGIEESVKLWHELVAVHPTQWHSEALVMIEENLTRALGFLFVSLHNLGRHSEALAAIEGSVRLWRELVSFIRYRMPQIWLGHSRV